MKLVFLLFLCALAVIADEQEEKMAAFREKYGYPERVETSTSFSFHKKEVKEVGSKQETRGLPYVPSETFECLDTCGTGEPWLGLIADWATVYCREPSITPEEAHLEDTINQWIGSLLKGVRLSKTNSNKAGNHFNDHWALLDMARNLSFMAAAEAAGGYDGYYTYQELREAFVDKIVCGMDLSVASPFTDFGRTFKYPDWCLQHIRVETFAFSDREDVLAHIGSEAAELGYRNQANNFFVTGCTNTTLHPDTVAAPEEVYCFFFIMEMTPEVGGSCLSKTTPYLCELENTAPCFDLSDRKIIAFVAVNDSAPVNIFPDAASFDIGNNLPIVQDNAVRIACEQTEAELCIKDWGREITAGSSELERHQLVRFITRTEDLYNSFYNLYDFWRSPPFIYPQGELCFLGDWVLDSFATNLLGIGLGVRTKLRDNGGTINDGDINESQYEHFDITYFSRGEATITLYERHGPAVVVSNYFNCDQGSVVVQNPHLFVEQPHLDDDCNLLFTPYSHAIGSSLVYVPAFGLMKINLITDPSVKVASKFSN